MSVERITAPDPVNADEAKEEETLRPHDFKSHIGQERIKKNLGLAITAARQRGDAIDHVLLYGPPGLGKTTMAWIIGREMNVNVRVTSGPAIERAGDLASLMTNLTDNDVLFIDEIHRLNRTVEEVLYSAMEDFKLDIMLGKGPSARSLRLDLPKFTLVGATTRVGGLSAPLRDRFGILHRFEFYEPGEVQQIIKRAARILGIEINDAATALIAQRSRLTPRIALRLLRRVRDYAQVAGQKRIEDKHAIGALKMLEIDEHGLDESDRRILRAIIENYGGGPVGVETLAALTSEERTTIEDFHEPFLMQIGLLERTPRGRKTTPKAHKHFGKNTNPTQPGQASLL